MQRLVCFVAFGVALVHSLPAPPYGVPVVQSQEAGASIKSQENEVNHDGSFKNNYETDNGIASQQVGYVKTSPNSPEPIQVIQGTSAYTAPDGQVIQIQYIADENGYQPQGSHLPTPPPADPAILRSLEYLASQPSTPEPPTAKFAGYQPRPQPNYAYQPQPPRVVYQQAAPQNLGYPQPNAPQKFVNYRQY